MDGLTVTNVTKRDDVTECYVTSVTPPFRGVTSVTPEQVLLTETPQAELALAKQRLSALSVRLISGDVTASADADAALARVRHLQRAMQTEIAPPERDSYEQPELRGPGIYH